MSYVTLFISHFYLLAIIYKLIIICNDCYVTVTTPINKDLQLPLYTISTRFPRILDTHSCVLPRHANAYIHLLTNLCVLILLTYILT